MGSNSKEVQTAQRERVEKELTVRLETLTQKGLSKAAANKDRTVRHLRADIKSIKKRIVAIDERGAQLQKAAEEKAARLAAPKPDKKKKAQADAAPAPKAKKKKEKK